MCILNCFGHKFLLERYYDAGETDSGQSLFNSCFRKDIPNVFLVEHGLLYPFKIKVV